MAKSIFIMSALFLAVWLQPSCTHPRVATSNAPDCYMGLNKVDKYGRPQGYWKVAYPDSNGHFRIIHEGFYYNGYQVGVWKRTNFDGSQIFQKKVFIDTTEHLSEVFNYDLLSNLVSKGTMTTVKVKDSIHIIDLRTGNLKWDTIRRYAVKDGHWEYYWDNGVLKNAGIYANDKAKGVWKFYNQKGELIKTEEY